MKKKIVLVLVLTLGLATDMTKADFTFGEPINLGLNVNTASGEGGNGLSISADELSIYFESDRSGGYGNADLWVATRATKNDDWTESVNLGSVVNGSAQDNSPSISVDGLSLYFSSNRSGTVGNMDLWVTTRETTADDWNEPVNLGTVVNSSVADYMSYISADGLSLYFSSERPGGLGLRDLWMTTRATTNDEWGEPVNLGPTVNSSSNERRMWISSDGLMILLQSDRPKGSGAVDIYMTTRLTTNDDWTEPVNIGPVVNVPQISEASPIVSSDGRTLYMTIYGRIGGYGTWDLWRSPIIPIVDLNSDGIVDCADMCIIIDNWGTDEPLCDIGPFAWGDGTVDLQDLVVLADYLGKEFVDPTLIAYWALDESDGTVAVDSTGGKDGYVLGDATWQPAGGQVDGALQLDGVDDYVIT
ncbi:MAG: PD40 domain-containing protein, partial [Sedimentisphaerales bacterium]|nr:PD40 domain-containing protein [Sedimentisphaerales bacterium]